MLSKLKSLQSIIYHFGFFFFKFISHILQKSVNCLWPYMNFHRILSLWSGGKVVTVCLSREWMCPSFRCTLSAQYLWTRSEPLDTPFMSWWCLCLRFEPFSGGSREEYVIHLWGDLRWSEFPRQSEAYSSSKKPSGIVGLSETSRVMFHVKWAQCLLLVVQKSPLVKT